ncbi:MAG: LysM peptidoglycan-binding domain-containing protein [Gemmatimonadetes bacterium]|nr:LysM peptidoglycan-binding domain-containing protein [Gemmatimonadota bacterium]
MARIFKAILILLAAPAVAAAQEAPGAAGGGGAPAASSHTVIVGETLWGLAYRYYGDPFHWPTIYEANRGEIEDPHWIYPEEQFVIPGAPNQPPRPFPSQTAAPSGQGDPAMVGDVAVQSPGSLPEAPPPYQPNQGRNRPSLLAHAPDYRTVFYDTAPVEYGAVHAAGRRDWSVVPRDAYYASEWLAVSAESAPRLGQVEDFHQILEKEHTILSAKNFDRLRIDLSRDHGVSIGDQLIAYRPVQVVRGMGTIMRPTGRMMVSRMEEGGAIAVVTAEFDRVQVGDLVDRLPAFPLEPGVYPSEVSSDVEGEIVGFGNPQELYGHADIAFISIGRDAGLELGDELEVRPPGRDGDWPEDAVGQVQVLRVDDYRASVRIIGVDNPVFTEGARVRLVRKMPG